MAADSALWATRSGHIPYSASGGGEGGKCLQGRKKPQCNDNRGGETKAQTEKFPMQRSVFKEGCAPNHTLPLFTLCASCSCQNTVTCSVQTMRTFYSVHLQQPIAQTKKKTFSIVKVSLLSLLSGISWLSYCRMWPDTLMAMHARCRPARQERFSILPKSILTCRPEESNHNLRITRPWLHPWAQIPPY